MSRRSGYIIAIGLGALVVAALFMPQIRQFWHNLRAEAVEVPLAAGNGIASPGETLNLEIITILGKDGIPAILDPQFISGREAAEQMVDSERVLGVSINGDHRAYPLNQLSRHEIVNDEVGGVPVAVTWWPLCFTGIVYARELEGRTHTFGVSGKLIMNALVMYDHQTDTLWSQFLSRGVKGPLSGQRLEIVPSIQTTWDQWLGLHPETLVLDKRGGFQRDAYEGYYRGGSAGIIGEANKDGRLPGKELVVGIDLEGSAKAYPFRVIAAEPVINDTFRGEAVVVTFQPISETGAVFRSEVGGQSLTFHSLPDASDGIMLMQDQQTGSTWQAVTGRAIEGPLAGAALQRLPSHYSFWFAWSDFHPDTELFEAKP